WAILVSNRARKAHRADGIVVTPSHNPPEDGGFKYNPPNGGPADTDVTGWVQRRANVLLRKGNGDVKRIPYAKAIKAASTLEDDLVLPYVEDLKHVVDMEAIRAASLTLGVDPLGGAALPYWEPINAIYKLHITVVNPTLDPTFSFMTVDHDGKIRMDPSSPYAMARLVGLKDHFGVAFANDPDSDRHGIVTSSTGLMNPNHYLAVAIRYLLSHRPGWPAHAAVGKTLVSSGLIDRVVAEFGTSYYTRIDAAATPEQKARLQKLSAGAVKEETLAGEPITAKLTRAPGNDAPIDGLKIVTPGGWFAARPSGTENIYKIYAESFRNAAHLDALVSEAQRLVDAAVSDRA